MLLSPPLWILSFDLLTPASELGSSNVISTSAGEVEDAEVFKKYLNQQLWRTGPASYVFKSAADESECDKV